MVCTSLCQMQRCVRKMLNEMQLLAALHYKQCYISGHHPGIYRRNLQILNTNQPVYWLSNMIDMFVSKLHIL